jgi:hypothetical protein
MSEAIQPIQTIQTQAAAQSQGGELTLRQVADRVNLVHEVLQKVMKRGTHYGTVPGCGAKMVLLKPGADVLAMTFRLVPQFAVTRADLPDGHREYDVTCSMFSAGGVMLGQGVGSASTMEKKYRYRKDMDGKRAENEDIADCYNTVLKIAKKRAHIDATLTVTGAADLFTQDLIDEDDAAERAPVAMPTARPTPSPTPGAAPSATAPATPAPATPAAPAAPAAPSSGPMIVRGVAVERSRKESPPTAARPWVKVSIKVGKDWYATFDHKLHERLMALAQNSQVELAYTTDAKGYRTIVELLSAAPPEAPANPPAGGGGAQFDDDITF